MTTVAVEFDGKTFVPQSPLTLPIGTRATVAIPDHESTPTLASPAADDDREWQEILADIRAADPEQGSLEDTMREIRMRP